MITQNRNSNRQAANNIFGWFVSIFDLRFFLNLCCENLGLTSWGQSKNDLNGFIRLRSNGKTDLISLKNTYLNNLDILNQMPIFYSIQIYLNRPSPLKATIRTWIIHFVISLGNIPWIIIFSFILWWNEPI